MFYIFQGAIGSVIEASGCVGHTTRSEAVASVLPHNSAILFTETPIAGRPLEELNIIGEYTSERGWEYENLH